MVSILSLGGVNGPHQIPITTLLISFSGLTKYIVLPFFLLYTIDFALGIWQFWQQNRSCLSAAMQLDLYLFSRRDLSLKLNY